MPLCKRVFKTLSEADKVFRSGDVYFVSLHVTDVIAKYIVVVYDDQHRYKFEIKDLTSFDFRMLRKVYTNVYYMSEEIAEMFPSRS